MKNLKLKMKNKKILKLKGKTAVFIDWANVHGWEKILKSKIDPKKLYKYLKCYKEIKSINFYFGTDTHPKSKSFIRKVEKIGYTISTKTVKYITVSQKPFIQKRKCDFDIEICMFTLLNIERYESFIYFSGDGDFAPLYKYLIQQNKQVIVVYSPKHIGREVWEIHKGLFKIKLIHLMPLKKSSPRQRRGA